MLASTPNDGSAIAAVPVGITTTARIMVKCSDNVFFNINDTDIVINGGSPSFVVTRNPTTGMTCDDTSISFTLESFSISGYTDPIMLTVSDLPPGASATIANNSITPGNNTLITIDDLDGLSDVFNIKITAVSGSITREVNFNLTVEESSSMPLLSSPANGATGTDLNPTLSWNSVLGATSYEYEVSTVTNGGNVVNTGNTALTSIVISPELTVSTTYYWRVRGTSSCGVTPWSDEWTFETGTCIVKSASDLPISISSVGTPTITSSLNILDKGIVTDLNVVSLIGTHTYISDLNFTLIAPDNTSLAFWSDPCNSQNNFNINFDDEAASNNYPCPPINGGTYQPDVALSAFDSKQILGEWTLSVFDDFNADGGELESWGIEICLDDFCDLTVDDNAYTNTFGTLNSALNCAIDGDVIYLETDLAGLTIDAGSGSIIIDKDISIIADPNDNIRVVSDGTTPTFIINAGKTVSLIGFEIENGATTLGVIENNGALTLEDMDVTAGAGKISVLNQIGANMVIEGDCRLQE
jgi:subtilisin-like proprotein convertase family protein